MANLWAAAAFFLAIHIGVSGTRLRDAVVGAVGEWPYLGAFALASVGGLVWLIIGYNEAVMEPDRLYWVAPVGLKHMAPPVMLVAFLFAVVGLTTPNPTAFRSERVLDTEGDDALGIVHITRHPFLWGVMIWSTLHIAMKGDKASILFFGTFLLVAALGTISIDEKRRRKLGTKWDAFAARTSNLPFAAIFAGRTKFRFTRHGWWRILASLIAFTLMLYAHLWLFGFSPIPGWQPY